ncbi:uncharacterized protein METZ01_LOCUS472157, partial [marine metagenome]
KADGSGDLGVNRGYFIELLVGDSPTTSACVTRE